MTSLPEVTLELSGLSHNLCHSERQQELWICPPVNKNCPPALPLLSKAVLEALLPLFPSPPLTSTPLQPGQV